VSFCIPLERLVSQMPLDTVALDPDAVLGEREVDAITVAVDIDGVVGDERKTEGPESSEHARLEFAADLRVSIIATVHEGPVHGSPLLPSSRTAAQLLLKALDACETFAQCRVHDPAHLLWWGEGTQVEKGPLHPSDA